MLFDFVWVGYVFLLFSVALVRCVWSVACLIVACLLVAFVLRFCICLVRLFLLLCGCGLGYSVLRCLFDWFGLVTLVLIGWLCCLRIACVPGCLFGFLGLRFFSLF